VVTLSFAIPLIGNLVLAGMVHHVRQAISSPRTLRRITLISGALLIAVGLAIPVI
jgi:cytochrome c biogenesis protein CcdA